MMIDGNELEKRAMELFREGRGPEARALQEQFLAEVMASGEDYCTCPGNCKWHGKCVECLIFHRGHADHLPHCLRKMINKHVEALSALTEHSMKPGEGGK